MALHCDDWGAPMQALSMVVSREGSTAKNGGCDSDAITKMQLYVPKITFRFVNHRLKTTIFKTIQLFKLIFSFSLPLFAPPEAFILIGHQLAKISKNQLENYCKTRPKCWMFTSIKRWKQQVRIQVHCQVPIQRQKLPSLTWAWPAAFHLSTVN